MKILFTGGFTLGSVTPLLAVAEELKKNAEVIWIGTRKGPERKLVEEAGIKFIWLWAPKLRRYFDWRNLFAPLALLLATKIAWFKLIKMRPDIIVTAGGYIGVPIVWAAWWLRPFGIRIPTILHNQDVRWSLASKLVAPFVYKITYALPGTVPKRWQKKAVWTGNPVRKFIFKGNVERGLKMCGFDRACPTILVIGGGTGAKRLNEIVWEALPELTEKYQVIHLTGRGKQSTSQILPTTNYCTFEFVTAEIADLYAAADLVITRAGMGVLTELAALGKPMLIVPLPHTHQEENARYFKTYTEVNVLSQNELDGKKLVEAIAQIAMRAQSARISQINKISELAGRDAAKQVANEITGLLPNVSH